MRIFSSLLTKFWPNAQNGIFLANFREANFSARCFGQPKNLANLQIGALQPGGGSLDMGKVQHCIWMEMMSRHTPLGKVKAFKTTFEARFEKPKHKNCTPKMKHSHLENKPNIPCTLFGKSVSINFPLFQVQSAGQIRCSLGSQPGLQRCLLAGPTTNSRTDRSSSPRSASRRRGTARCPGAP